MADAWTRDDLDLCIGILSHHNSVTDACAEIRRRVGRKVYQGTLAKVFQRADLMPPSRYLATARVDLQDIGEDRGATAQARYTAKLERRVGDRLYLGEKIGSALRHAFAANPIQLTYQGQKRRRATPAERLLVAMWSDIHFGLDVDPREIPGNEYNWRVAARRMAKLCVQLAEWKPEHRDETDLQIVINGDVIAGIIHTDDAGLRPLTEQIHGATWILVACIDYLRHHFRQIRIGCLPGNHDRVKRERQLSQRWDAYSSQVYTSLAAAFRTADDVVFEVPLTGDIAFPLPGGDALGFATHGDVAPNVGNIGRTVDVRKMESALRDLNASEEFPLPVRVMLLGHWHTPLYAPFATGSVIVNGCVIGADSFARNALGVRGIGSNPAQVMFESVPGYPVGDLRVVNLRDADSDEGYDEVVSTPVLDLARVA